MIDVSFNFIFFHFHGFRFFLIWFYCVALFIALFFFSLSSSLVFFFSFLLLILSLTFYFVPQLGFQQLLSLIYSFYTSTSSPFPSVTHIAQLSLSDIYLTIYYLPIYLWASLDLF